jgi:hypothetical protein
MFNDWDWDGGRTAIQHGRLNAWLRQVASSPMVVVECGAGTAIPTVRQFCEDWVDGMSGRLVRINLREPEAPGGHIGLAMGALAGLRAIDECLAAAHGDWRG